jgi:hypothetical protein
LFAEGALSAAFRQSFYRLSNQQKRGGGVAAGEPRFERAGGYFERCYNRRNFFRASLLISSPRIFAGKSRARLRRFDADNVSVYSARRAGGGGDGRFEYERNFRHSGFGFDGFQHRFDGRRSRRGLLAFRRRLARLGDKNAIPSDAAQWAIIGMAIGTLIGGAAQFLMQLPSLFKVGFVSCRF